MVEGIKEEDFNDFTKDMWKKLKEGEKKYGTKFKTANLVNEMKAEAIDICNYAFMLYLQTKNYGELNEKLEMLNNAEKIFVKQDGVYHLLHNKGERGSDKEEKND